MKVIAKRDVKIEKLTQKIKELENHYGDNMKEKEKLVQLEDKVAKIKNRGESLRSIYYSIVPQIQCPFGH